MTGRRGAVDQAAPRTIRTILHVDMDAFYVSVETLLDPSLKGKPVIVGGEGARGVVASCSYEARAFGVRSAMSSIQAKRLCPQAIFLRGNHGLYGEYSEKIHEIFRSFTPLVEGIALDEAFLDVTGARKLFGRGSDTAIAVRARIADDLNLNCSVGVATSKLLAKLASVAAKPVIGRGGPRVIPGASAVAAGVVEVLPGDELAFLHPHPARALWGIGPKTFERLARFGVETVGDLAALPEATVVTALGTASGRHLHALANAVDERPVEPDRAVKSIGHEETFAVDHHDLDPLRRELLRMADAVATRTRAAGVQGRTVQLKLKLSDFRSLTRSRTLPEPADTATVIAAAARALLEEPDVAELVGSLGVRLLGVSVANLVESKGEQLHLFGAFAGVAESLPRSPGDDLAASETASPSAASTPVRLTAEQDRHLAGTIDAIRSRFGSDAVGSAALASGGRLRIKRPGDTQWGPSEPTE